MLGLIGRRTVGVVTAVVTFGLLAVWAVVMVVGSIRFIWIVGEIVSRWVTGSG